MKDTRTFKEIAAAVLEAPDFQVETCDRVVGSTHLAANTAIEIVRSSVSNRTGSGLSENPADILEAIAAKNRLLEVLDEIEAGRTKPAMNLTLKICK